MSALDGVNHALALLTILFGAIALAVAALHDEGAPSGDVAGRADGKAELRAASGGAFVATGAAAMLLGAAFSDRLDHARAALRRRRRRATDGDRARRAGNAKMWGFFAIEAVFALWLIAANWPA